MRRALGAWMRERFPARNAVFFVVFYATALLVARGSSGAGPVVLAWSDIAGFIALWCFFLMLRVFDEHKDFEADALAHPQRVLQRGLIMLRDLEVVGIVTIAIQLGVSLWLDGTVGQVTAWWAAAFAWSILMAREFFVRDWIRKHLVIYAISHMAVMPIIAMWVAAMGSPRASESPAAWAFAALSLLAGLAFEIARKIRAPEEEHPMADSYTRALGIHRASAVLLCVVMASALASLLLSSLATGGISAAAYAALGGSVLLAAAAIVRFRLRPTPGSAKTSEAAVGIATLTTHAVVIVAVLARHGLAIQ